MEMKQPSTKRVIYLPLSQLNPVKEEPWVGILYITESFTQGHRHRIQMSGILTR